MIEYVVQIDLEYFDAWSGGRDTLDDLIEYNVVDRAEEYINEIASTQDKPLTRTEINDILWFERDEIYKYCGIYDDIYPEDEDEESEEDE